MFYFFIKRIVYAISALIIATFLLIDCGSQEPKEVISTELGIDVSGSNELSYFDNHSGFHGDGMTCIAISFSDNKTLEQIKENTQWKEFPLDRTVSALVYGISDTTSIIGPFLKDENSNPLVPEIQNGYYLLIDRQTNTETDILLRSSFNFTLGLYDTDTDTLYYCRLDT